MKWKDQSINSRMDQGKEGIYKIEDVNFEIIPSHENKEKNEEWRKHAWDFGYYQKKQSVNYDFWKDRRIRGYKT